MEVSVGRLCPIISGRVFRARGRFGRRGWSGWGAMGANVRADAAGREVKSC